MRETESAWNQIIWQAIKDLKEAYTANNIDDIFSICENELYALNAPKKETELRLFALALYCNEIHSLYFFRSLVYSRFGAALDIFHFKSIARNLIKEKNLALVVFWVIFRLSFKKFLSKKSYLQLEAQMKSKSYELGTNFVY